MRQQLCGIATILFAIAAAIVFRESSLSFVALVIALAGWAVTLWNSDKKE